MRPLKKYHFEIDSLPEGGATIKGEVELGPMPPHDPSKNLEQRKVYARMAPMFAAVIAEIFRDSSAEAETQYNGPMGEVKQGPWPGSGEEPRNGHGRTHAEQVAYERERGPYKPEEGEGTVSDDEEEAEEPEIADPPV